MKMLSLCGMTTSVPSPRPFLHNPPKFMECNPLSIRLDLDWSAPSRSSVCTAKSKWVQGRNLTVAIKARALSDNNAPGPSRQCIVLDIEGATTPISFVFDVLFPYARDNVRNHLIATYGTEETQNDIRLLRAQVHEDLEQGLAGTVPIPPDDAGKDEVIAALVANVEAMIRADRKIKALKELQGHIWRTGFQNNELKGVVFDDVPKALERWHAMGIKVYHSDLGSIDEATLVFGFLNHPLWTLGIYLGEGNLLLRICSRILQISLPMVYIYSSGSREAQRLIFGNTIYGDLRKYLCGFFDTMIGDKRETRSYLEIFQSVGVDKPSQILFVTDVYQEAMAAKAAGLEVIISIRPGNAPLPENHGFTTIESFSEI